MSSLFKFLIDGIAAVTEDEIISPTEKVFEDEIVIGEITDPELRRYLMFLKKYEEKLKNATEESLHTALVDLLITKRNREKHDIETCPNCAKRTILAADHAMYDGLKELFWAHVRKSLPIGARIKIGRANHIAIREGWKIAIKPQNGAGILDVLRDLLCQEEPITPPADPRFN